MHRFVTVVTFLCAGCWAVLDPGGFVLMEDAGRVDAGPVGGRDGGPSPTLEPASYVRVVHDTDGSLAVRGFFALAPTAERACTTIASEGDCLVQDCEALTTPARSASAGQLRVEANGTFIASPGGPNGYTMDSAGFMIEPGDVVTVSAEGADVPAFAASAFSPPVRDYGWLANVVRDAAFQLDVATTAADRIELRLASASGREVVCATTEPSIGSFGASRAIMSPMPLGAVRAEMRYYTVEEVSAAPHRIRLEVASADHGELTLE